VGIGEAGLGSVDMRVVSTPTVGQVHVRLGPLPSDSARSWIGYARDVLAAVPTEAGGEGVWLPADAVAGFEQFLDDWALAADESDTFRWRGEIPREQAEYLFHAFFRVATHLSARAETTGPMAPVESEPFYRTLVGGLLTALDQEGDATSEFSEHLRAFWPGLET
jgi:hypothetical protein